MEIEGFSTGFTKGFLAGVRLLKNPIWSKPESHLFDFLFGDSLWNEQPQVHQPNCQTCEKIRVIIKFFHRNSALTASEHLSKKFWTTCEKSAVVQKIKKHRFFQTVKKKKGKELGEIKKESERFENSGKCTLAEKMGRGLETYPSWCEEGECLDLVVWQLPMKHAMRIVGLAGPFVDFLVLRDQKL